MKEWLLKTEEGKYYFHCDDMDFCPKYVEKIEIPKVAHIAFLNGLGNVCFTTSDWMTEIKDGSIKERLVKLSDHYKEAVIWQRKDESVVDAEFFEEEKKVKTVEETLSERQSQYGCFEDVAKTTQDILKALREGNYDGMPDPHKESLHMIASKMARLVHGDYDYKDNWHDIGGYAKLIENLIGGEDE